MYSLAGWSFCLSAMSFPLPPVYISHPQIWSGEPPGTGPCPLVVVHGRYAGQLLNPLPPHQYCCNSHHHRPLGWVTLPVYLHVIYDLTEEEGHPVRAAIKHGLNGRHSECLLSPHPWAPQRILAFVLATPAVLLLPLAWPGWPP